MMIVLLKTRFFVGIHGKPGHKSELCTMMTVVVLLSAEMSSFVLPKCCRKEKSTVSRIALYLHAGLNRRGSDLSIAYLYRESRSMASLDDSESELEPGLEPGLGSGSDSSLPLHERWPDTSLPPQKQCPSCYEFVGLLKYCTSTKDVVRGRTIHGELARLGWLEKNVFIRSALIDMYAKCGSLASSREVFDMLPNGNMVCWNALIGGYAGLGYHAQGLDMYRSMQSSGISSDDVTTLSGLRCCGGTGDANSGQEIHIEIIKKGFEEGNLRIGSTLVDMYAKCGCIESAQVVFSSLKVRNVVMWNSIITAYSEYGLVEEVAHHFEQMHKENISPSAVTYTCMLRIYGAIGCLDEGMKRHGELTFKGMERDVVVGSSLVDLYVKSGALSEAQEVFRKLDSRDVVSWNVLLAGFVEYGRIKDAFDSLRDMQYEGVSPDGTTYMCLLRGCHIEKGGWEMHDDIVRKGLESNLFIRETLIQMYARCGIFAEAHNEFDKLNDRTLVAWNGLIQGYTDHGYYEKVLSHVKMMQDAGLSWNSATLLCGLQACIHTKARDCGLKFHADVLQKGLLQSDASLGGVLIDMYAKFGSLMEMQVVFNRSPVRDVASWNSMMAGYAEAGCFKEALYCFAQMKDEVAGVDCVAFMCILKACIGLGSIDKGREMHIDIVNHGLLDKDPSFSVANSLIDMYMKLGFPAEAHDVFNKLGVRDANLWTSLISGYMGNGDDEDALKCYAEMQNVGMLPLVSTFGHVLKACSRLGFLIPGREIHARLVCEGFEREASLSTALVEMYAKCGCFAEGKGVLPRNEDGDVVLARAMVMSEFSKRIRVDDKTKLMEWVQQYQGMSAGHRLYVLVLRACGKERQLSLGEDVHSEIVKTGFEICAGVELVEMYAGCGCFAEAKKLVEESPRVRGPIVAMWNALISGYVEHGRREEVSGCLERMQEEGISRDSATLACIVKSCIHAASASSEGREAHADAVRRGSEAEPLVGNALVRMYAKRGGVAEEARSVFDRLTIRDVVAWTAIVSGYVERGNAEHALECLGQMRGEGISPDALALASGLAACADLRSLLGGRSLHSEAVELGIEQDVGNSVIRMYAECGCLAEARELCSALCGRDAEPWNALIAGYSEHGSGDEALRCFEELAGITAPHPVAFVHLLRACGSTKNAARGRAAHCEAVCRGFDDEGIAAVGNAVACMYAKCGSLPEARQTLAERLRSGDDAAVAWNILIAAYVEQGCCEDALRCWERMRGRVCADGVTLLVCLAACASSGALDAGREIHLELAKRGCDEAAAAEEANRRRIGNALLDMYAKCAALPAAARVFRNLPARDAVSWNAILTGYAQLGDAALVFGALEAMLGSGAKPDLVTALSLLTACNHAGLADAGEMCLEAAARSWRGEMIPADKHFNCLVDLLGRAGRIDRAAWVAESMPLRPTGLVWQTLLGACKKWSHSGLWEHAFRCAQELDDADVGASIYVCAYNICCCADASPG